jgi:hypothetical protein
MKRFALLLTVSLIITIFVSSPLLASPPRIENRIASFYAVVSRYILQFIGPFSGYVELPLIDNGGNSGMLGGDADDYANGRSGIDGDDKMSGQLKAGPGVIGSEEIKPVLRILYGI